MISRKWILSPPLPQEARAGYPELPEVVLTLLWNRGIKTQKEIDEFLNPDYGEDIYDPFIFRDMEKAIERIFQAIKKDEKIVIHGDYDADGVCGSVILYETLKMLEAKNVNVFLPHRETEGYGVNPNTIKNFKKDDVNLIITCDCGISNVDSINEAQNLGIDVIITDHHEVPEKVPAAYAIIHPKIPEEKYPHKELSGGAVAFKLACGLIEKSNDLGFNFPKGIEKWFLDIVAISLVADVIPLLGEARTLAKYGLIVLHKTRNLGLKYLCEAAKISTETIDIWSIGYTIAPRINAAGRMNHANTAYKLLISKDEAEAKKLANELNQSNYERQRQTDLIVAEAREEVVRNKMDKKFAIAVLKDDWSLGLLGLVAGKLSGEFYRPVVACSKKDGLIVGSGRCDVEGFDLLKSLRSLSEFFEKLGGHKSACGFTLKKEVDFNEFYEKWEKECAKKLEGVDLTPSLFVDSELSLDDIDWELYDILSKLEPFGENNPRPRYLAKGVTIKSLDLVGNNNNHLRLQVQHKGIATKKMIGFCLGDPERNGGTNWYEKLKIGDKIDVVFEVGVNEWNGNREIQLKIIDLKLSE